MSDRRPPVLLQVCPNDHPPFADVCRYHAAVAASLAWRSVTVVLEPRSAVAEASFHYPRDGFAACVTGLLGGQAPILTLCHRYRAYRAVMTSGLASGPVVAVAHEFGLLRRRRRRWQRHWDRLRGRPRVIFAGVSDAVAAELGSVVERAVVLPNGLDLSQSDADRATREEALRRLGLSPVAFNIGVVGRLHPKKNPVLALAGFARVADRMPEAALVFLGDGELTEPVRRAADGLPVTLAGFVPDAPRLMAAFDLLLIPSGADEAFGMVALEAMAAGVPVLCGPAPGPRFVAGDHGRFFAADRPDDVGEGLLTAYRDWRAGSLPDIAGQARLRVEQVFSVEAGAARLARLVDGVDAGISPQS